MRFKNSSQRAAVMAKLRDMGFSRISAQYYAQKGVRPSMIKNKNFKQLQRMGIYLKYQGDADKDGVKNVKDCQPLDRKDQGFIHDIKMNYLKKREERAESNKEALLKKLEDKRDELNLRKSIAQKEMTAREAEVAQKSALVKMRRDEEDAKKRLEAQNKKADEYLRRTSAVGKLELKAKAYGAGIKKRWNSPEGRANRAKAARELKSIWRKLK